MVKADAKHDYYGDLELEPTADADEIKRQFRTLAKQYHPDRNPGREVDVVSKFQAVQAAHEILSDPQQKTKYDSDRAKIARATNAFNATDSDPYDFRRPTTKPPASASAYAPPPRRAATSNPAKSPFTMPNARPRPAQAASGADKFNAFTRAAPQQWDRAKFDEAARADAARGFQSMKNTRAAPQAASQTVPQAPPRPSRHPTARRPFDDEPPPNVVDEQPGLRPGFPGMSRTASVRKHGFDPTSPSPGMDEPPAPRASAYATYNRGERPQASTPQGYFPEGLSPQSPPMAFKRPVLSPLRHVRSSGFDGPQASRPELERLSSRYATGGGERTNIGGGLGRSASVRTSPVERSWEEESRSHSNRPHSHYEPSTARHHSASPKLRHPGVNNDFSSSESDSSGEDAAENFANRPKAQYRRNRPRVQTMGTSSSGHQHFSDHDPALTGQFPSNNYTKLHDDNSTSHYDYPPPRDGPVRRPFANMTVPNNSEYPEVKGNGGNADAGHSKYEPPRLYSRDWSEDWKSRLPNSQKSGVSGFGLPLWAVPSSVMPQSISPTKRSRLGTIKEEKGSGLRNDLSRFNSSSKPTLTESTIKADVISKTSHRNSQDPTHSSQNTANHHSVSEENISTTFSAADWDGKFASGDEYLRPTTDSHSRERKSPSKTSRTRAKSVGKGHGIPQSQQKDGPAFAAGTDGNTAAEGSSADDRHEDVPEQTKGMAFQPGKFSAEEWAEKLQDQTWSVPSNELNNSRSKTPKRSSKSAARKPPPVLMSQGMPSAAESTDAVSGADDAMDIDGNSATVDHSNPTVNGTSAASERSTGPYTATSMASPGVTLDDLAKTAPFAPSATGLKDLDDLSTTLPFESRAAPALNLNHTTSTTARRLNLPRPPKAVIPPPEDKITQESWERYVREINAYLHDWNVFNVKMLDHFRTRQDQVSLGMSPHWISSIGDGPSAEAFEAANGEGPSAGFATYMAWIEDDAKCRSWWDFANERHRECFEDVARIREKVKQAAGVV